MPRKPIVFIPGFPASSLEDDAGRKVYPPGLEDLTGDKGELIATLQGPDDPNADDGIRGRSPIRYSFRIPLLDAGKEAQSLYDLLEDDLGYDTQGGADFEAVGWDWRRSLRATATLDRVQAAIESFSEPATILCHSTGGLVARALFEERPDLAARVEQVVAIGVPWAGVIKSFRYLEPGVRVGVGPITLLSAEESRRVMSRAHAAYDILPPVAAATAATLADPPLFLADGQPVTPLTERSWVHRDEDVYHGRLDGALDREGGRGTGFPVNLPVLNLCGVGVEMDTLCDLTSGTPTYGRTKLGDGTVPIASSTWLRGDAVKTFRVPAGVYADQLITQKHSQLWRTPPVKRFLRSRLLGEAERPFFGAAVDNDSAVDTLGVVHLRLSAADADGRPLPGARAVCRDLPGRPAVELDGATYGEMQFSRDGLVPNVGNQLRRLEVELTWDGAPEPLREPLIVYV